jgi:hypothetical protein
VVGYHDSSYVGQDRPALRYAGKVGTGFDQRALTAVRHRCDELGTDRCPFGDQAREGGAHRLRPELVAQVGFTERTRAQHRAVLRPILEHRREVPQLREMWLVVLQPIHDGVVPELDRARELGLAPPGARQPSARDRAVVEYRQLPLLRRPRRDRGTPSEKDVSGVVEALWPSTRTLYGTKAGDDEAARCARADTDGETT